MFFRFFAFFFCAMVVGKVAKVNFVFEGIMEDVGSCCGEPNPEPEMLFAAQLDNINAACGGVGEASFKINPVSLLMQYNVSWSVVNSTGVYLVRLSVE